MFERFTERARQVVVLAQEEARTLKNNYIGTEHILLGLLREEEGIAARALESLGITVEGVRAQVVRIVGCGEEVTSGQVPFTPARQEGPRARAARGAVARAQLHRHRAHPARPGPRERGRGRARHAGLRRRLREDPRGGHPRPLGTRRASPGAGGAQLDALLDGAGALLGILGGEIEERLEHPADAGDLLVVLACIPGGLAARTLAAVGIDATALAGAGDEARRSDMRAALLPPPELAAEIEQLRAEERAAVQRAADLRDRVRELTEQARQTVEQRQEEVLDEVRGRLGLTDD